MNADEILDMVFPGQIRDDIRFGRLEELAAVDKPEGTCNVHLSATYLFNILRELSHVQRNSN